MFARLTVLGLSLCAALPTLAAVELQTPEELVLVAINDQDVKSGFLGGAKKYQLDAGQHQLQLRYQQYFDLNNNEHDIVRSGVIRLTTPELKDGAKYQLTLLDAPQTHDAAKTFAAAPRIGLLNAEQQLVAEQQGRVQQVGLLNQLFGQIQDLSTGVTGVTQLKTSDAKAGVADTTAQATTHATTHDIDQQLIQLWQQATPQQRQKFTAWLAAQEK